MYLCEASVESDHEKLRLYSNFDIEYLYQLEDEANERVPVESDPEYRLVCRLYSALRELRRLDLNDAVVYFSAFPGMMNDTLILLLTRFWNRVCVIQELALAPSTTLFCRDAVLQGSYVQAFTMTMILKSSQEFNNPFARFTFLLIIREFVQERLKRSWTAHGLSIVEFLRITRGSSTSDPRDQIFGLQGLARECGGIKLPLSVDCKGAIEVYVEFGLDVVSSKKLIVMPLLCE